MKLQCIDIDDQRFDQLKSKYLFLLPMKVRDYEVDSQGIVNNANYLHYMEHTRHEFCLWAGTTFRSLQERGIDPVVREVKVTYLSPLRLGEEFVSCLNLHKEGAKFMFEHSIYHVDENVTIACRADLAVVCLENGRITRGEVLSRAFSKYFDTHNV